MKKTKLFSRTAAGVLCLSLLFSSVSCMVVEKTPDETTAQTTAGEEIDWSKPLYKTANFTFTEDEIYYFIYNIVDQIMASYGGTFGDYGGTDADLTKSLKEQYIMSDTTWFDYCVEYALEDEMNYYFAMLEGAKLDGVTLTDEEKASVRSQAESTDLSKFANKISVETLTKCLEYTALATKYQNKLVSDVDISESALRTELETNMKDYCTVDYIVFSAQMTEDEKDESTKSGETTADTSSTDTATGDETSSDGETTEAEKEEITVITESQGQQIIDILKACKTPEEFKTKLAEVYSTYYPEMDSEDIESNVDYSCVENASYSAGYEVFDWMFSTERNANDIYCDLGVDMEGYCTVVMLSKTMSEDTSPTVNAAHILITESTYGSDGAAKAMAEDILKQFTDSGKDPEKFVSLAAKYSEDPGSAQAGGLYENITEGEMVEEFNDWCFDESRVEGDCEIVKTDYGYHIMLYKGHGLSATLASIAADLQNTYLNDKYESITTSYPLESNTPRLNAMEI